MFRPTVLLMAVVLSASACSEATATPAPTPATSTTAAITSTTSTAASPSTTAAPAPTSTTTTVAGPVVTAIEIALTGGTVERVERFDVPLDGAVRVTISGDVSDEVHLHGYDLHADIAPDTAGVIEFDATIPGVFEIELEDSGVLIGELQVAP